MARPTPRRPAPEPEPGGALDRSRPPSPASSGPRRSRKFPPQAPSRARKGPFPPPRAHAPMAGETARRGPSAGPKALPCPLPAPITVPAGRAPAPVETVAAAETTVRGARAQNAARASGSDWRHFLSWGRRQGFLAGRNAGSRDRRPRPRRRRLMPKSAPARPQNPAADPGEPRAAALGAGLARPPARLASQPPGPRHRPDHGRHPSGTAARPKEALLAEHLLAMRATLPFDLRGLRDRAILLLGFAGLRRSEIVGSIALPRRPRTGAALSRFSRTAPSSPSTARPVGGWSRSGAAPRNAPVRSRPWRPGCASRALRRARCFGGCGPQMPTSLPTAIARLVKSAALTAGLRAARRGRAGTGLRRPFPQGDLASAAEVDEAPVQRQLGHASAEMARRY